MPQPGVLQHSMAQHIMLQSVCKHGAVKRCKGLNVKQTQGLLHVKLNARTRSRLAVVSECDA